MHTWKKKYMSISVHKFWHMSALHKRPHWPQWVTEHEKETQGLGSLSWTPWGLLHVTQDHSPSSGNVQLKHLAIQQHSQKGGKGITLYLSWRGTSEPELSEEQEILKVLNSCLTLPFVQK